VDPARNDVSQEYTTSINRVGETLRYELAFYIPEDDILHSHRLENLKSHIALTGWVP
jgi:hypothetical protein